MTSELREQLIEAIIDTQPRLAGFVRPYPHDLSVASWDLMAYGFQKGFELMWDHARAESSGVLQRPLLSLWRHSVELSLKSAVAEVGGGMGGKHGHNLRALFDQLLKDRAALGHSDDDDLARDVAAMIALVQSLDPTADRFRYPTARHGQPFVGLAVDLDALFQAHWIIVTWCEGAALEVKEALGPV